MTLIASFTIQNHPVLIGDLMLSCRFDQQTHQPFSIPTHDDVNQLVPNATGRLITKLVQKVNLLSPRLVVAWSGNEDIARDAMFYLRETAMDKDLQWTTISDYLDGLPRQNTNLSLIGLFLERIEDEGVRIKSFSWNSAEGRLSNRTSWPLIQNCFVAGTGTSSFGELAESAEKIVSPEIAPLEKAILTTLSLLGKLMGRQLRNSEGLEQQYGGGFENSYFFQW